MSRRGRRSREETRNLQEKYQRNQKEDQKDQEVWVEDQEEERGEEQKFDRRRTEGNPRVRLSGKTGGYSGAVMNDQKED